MRSRPMQLTRMPLVTDTVGLISCVTRGWLKSFWYRESVQALYKQSEPEITRLFEEGRQGIYTSQLPGQCDGRDEIQKFSNTDWWQEGVDGTGGLGPPSWGCECRDAAPVCKWEPGGWLLWGQPLGSEGSPLTAAAAKCELSLYHLTNSLSL